MRTGLLNDGPMNDSIGCMALRLHGGKVS